MTNKFKYNPTGSEENSVSINNWAITTEGSGRGPTSTTGFWNGIEVPGYGGWTVYSQTSNGPIVRTAINEAEFLRIISRIGGDSSSVGNALEWAKNNNTLVTNFKYENIVTENLLFSTDEQFAPSYPRAGSTIYNMGTLSSDGSLVNGLSHTNKKLILDGVDDYINLNTNDFKFVDTDLTFETWVRFDNDNNSYHPLMTIINGSTSAGNPAILLSKSRNGIISNFSTNPWIYGGVTFQLRTPTETISAADNVQSSQLWRMGFIHYVGTIKKENGNYVIRLYRNGTLVGETNSTITTYDLTTSTMAAIGGWNISGNSPGRLKGELPITRIYTKALSLEEVQQNYNAQKDRFSKFVFTVDTTSSGTTNSTQFRLPINSISGINFVVDWGDGTTDTITSHTQAQLTHTYQQGGIYEISITGNLVGWAFNGGGDRLKMLNISNWGCFNMTHARAFEGCQLLECTAVDPPTITTTNLYRCFQNCTKFNGAIGNWNLSNVTSLQEMFSIATTFNQNIGGWDVSKVTTLRGTFEGASSFNNGGSSSINNWNTVSVTNMEVTFPGATSFNQPIGGWNTSNVTNMARTFGGYWGGAGATVFNQDIGAWDVSKVTTMFAMFKESRAFNNGGSPNINNWNPLNVTSMGEMFSNCSAFNQPIGNWNVGNVTTINNMFSSTPFNQDIGAWDVSKVTSIANTFLFCPFNNGGSPSIANWNTGNVTNMNQAFYHSGINQPIGNWNTSKVTNMAGMMRAVPFNQPIGSWDVSKVTTFNAKWWSANAFDQDLGPWNPAAATDLNNFLANRGPISTANLDSIYINWSQRTLKTGVTANFGGAKYSTAGAAGRAALISNFGWTIIDGGPL